LRGDEKRKEKKRDLFKIRKIFRKRYGTVFVRFGTPISLRRYLKELQVEDFPESVEKRRELYQKAADDVIRAIQEAMAVTPSSLVAAALLSRVDRSISRSQVLETAELYLGFLRKMKVDVSLGGVEDREALLRALDLFTQDGIVRKGVEIDTSDPPFHVPPEKRIHLEFSKNMMVAHLAPISLYAWSLRTARCDRRMSTYGVFMFLFRLLKYEFLLPVDHPMKGYRWGREELETRGGDEIRDLCHLTLNTLEGFWVGASYLLKEMGEEWIKERKLIQEMIRWGKEMLKTGQIRCPESFTSATLQGWLRIALEERILKGEEGHSGEKRREKRLGKGPNFNRIEEMVETLQRILACG